MTTSVKEHSLVRRMQTGTDFDARVIYLVGDIDSAMYGRIVMGLHQLDRTDGDILIILNSNGGCESSGYAIYDTIRMCKNKVIIHGYGSVSSIAAAIFQAADWRCLSINTDYLIHNGSINTPEDVAQDTILDMAEQIKKNNKRYHAILTEASGIKLKEIEEMCEQDTTLHAQEALNKGFCDEIIKPVKERKTKKKKRK